MTIDFDAQVRLQDLRLRITSGEEVTPQEMRLVLLDLQRGRDAAAKAAASASRNKKKVVERSEPIDFDKLFGSVGGT